jgi:membrane protease subunit HflK
MPKFFSRIPKVSLASLFSLFSWSEDDQDSNKKSENSKSNPNRQNKNNSGPPDLDELFKKAQQWLSNNLGKKKKFNFNGGSGSGSGGNFDLEDQGKLYLAISAVILVFLLAIVGFYKIEPGEQAVEYRFGKYIGMTGPGPHWILPGIYSKEIVNTSVIHQKNFEDDLITKEVDLVTVAIAVQYRINNLQNYLFKVRSAEDSLAEVTRAAIRQVVSESTLEQVLSTRGSDDKAFMGDQIKSLIEQNLKTYQAGLEINGVEILSVLPPQQVKEAFNDAIQAQEDEIRYQNEAEAYERKIVPVAEGNAARVLQDANAYVSQTLLAAEGDVSRFNAILPEYTKAPQVTRNRLYINAMEKTLKNTPKILVDSKSNNILFLPLDKFNLDGALKSLNKKTLATNESQLLIDNADNSINSINSIDSADSRQGSSRKIVKQNTGDSQENNNNSRSWRN